MTLKRTSRVSGSMRMRSMAPGAARMPNSMWEPSKAGPVAHEVESIRSRLPSTSSPLVPMSRMSRTSSCL